MEIKNIRKFREILRQFDRELFFQNNASCCNGISLAQCHTLLEIENQENISMSVLAKILTLDKSTISRTVDGLVNIGLVNREIPANNRRMSTLSLTEQGKKTCQTINYNNDKYVDGTFEGFSETEQQEFIKLFEKVTQNMSKIRQSTKDKENPDCC